MFDLYTGEVFKPVGREPVGVMTDAPKNTYVDIIHADFLVDRLKNRKLIGKLKQVAETLKEEDNSGFILG